MWNVISTKVKFDLSVQDLLTFVAIVASAAILFFIDLQLSKGTLDGYPYVIPLVGSMFIHMHYVAFPIAAVLAIAAIIGHLHSDLGGGGFDRETIGILNVAIAIAALFGTAAAIEHSRSLRTQLFVRVRQLQQAEELRNRIMSIIAHDLRSPLNPIIGFASLIADSRARLTDDKLKEYGTAIADSGQRLLATLDRLLDWARSSVTNPRVSPVATELQDLVNDAITLLQPVAAEKKIRLATEVQMHTVYCDPEMISTVLRNLISNAIKFSFPDQNISIISNVGPSSVTIRVVDQGVGMGDFLIEKLAAKKSIDSQAGTSGERGTGLGLTICRSLIEQNGGSIEFAAIKGQGTTVSVTIPRFMGHGAASP